MVASSDSLKVSEKTMLAALAKSFSAPQWAFITKVANSLGPTRSRTVDAMAMSMWASHGFGLHGIEVKISRADWLRELKDLTKAETVAQYCDFWWIAVPDRKIVKDDLPDAWGLLEVKNGRVTRVVKATKTGSVDPPRDVLAAFLRAATASSVSTLALEDAQRKGEEQAVKAAMVKARAEIGDPVVTLERLQRAITEFEKEVGFSIRSTWSLPDEHKKMLADLGYSSPKQIGEAVAELVKGTQDLKRVNSTVEATVKSLRHSADHLEQTLKDGKARG